MPATLDSGLGPADCEALGIALVPGRIVARKAGLSDLAQLLAAAGRGGAGVLDFSA
jgi:hypothetical protein